MIEYIIKGLIIVFILNIVILISGVGIDKLFNSKYKKNFDNDFFKSCLTLVFIIIIIISLILFICA